MPNFEPPLVADAKGAAELARARELDEGFEPVERPEDEPVEVVEVSADELTRASQTITELIKAKTSLENQVRELAQENGKYYELYGPLPQ